MIIEFQFTLDDYRNGMRAHYRKGASTWTRWMLRLAQVFGVLLLLFGVVFLLTGERALNVILAPTLLGALWIWIGWGGSYRLSARKQFVKSPALRGPRRVEFSDDGVKTDAGIASSHISWKAFLRYVESDACFLLYTSPVAFIIVPRRVLQPEQMAELRHLLETNIGKAGATASAAS